MSVGVVDIDGCGDGDRNLGMWSGAFFSTDTSFGVFGGYGIQVLSGGNVVRAISPLSEVVVGYHLNIRVWSNAPTGPELHFREGSTVHAKLLFNQGGAIQVIGGAGTVLDTVPSGSFPLQAWSYVEVMLGVSDGSGYLKLHLFGNPDPIIEVAGDFRNGGTGVVDNVIWAGGDGNTHWIDDVYFQDGSLVSLPLGGIAIGTCTANSDDTAEFDRSSGSTNHSNVDEVPFSGADYVETDVDGEKDLYGITAVGDGFQIHAVRVVGQMKKSDAGAASARLIIEDDGNQGSGATRALSVTPTVYSDTFAAPPSNPSGDWDETIVNALLIGVERPA